MLAVHLIRFLLKPHIGKIHALNSPFEQDIFRIETALNWVRRGKAEIEDGVLIFLSDFRYNLIRQHVKAQEEKVEINRWESMIDQEYSRGLLRPDAQPSVGRWVAKNAGGSPMPGAPDKKTHQMLRRWKNGSFRIVESKK